MRVGAVPTTWCARVQCGNDCAGRRDSVGRQSTQGTLSVHARPDPTVLEDLEEVVRRSGLEIERQASRRENVDVVIEYTLRGPKRLHDEVMIALLHHASVRTVSTGE